MRHARYEEHGTGAPNSNGGKIGLAKLKLTHIYDATLLSCEKCDVWETVINHGGHAACGGFGLEILWNKGL